MKAKHSYGNRGREWNPRFIEYADKIVNHPNYQGIPGGIVEDGKIRWNAPSHRPPGNKWSNLHDERFEWWKKKAEEIDVPIEGQWISKVAKAIHPWRKKPCQTCGRVFSLRYEYPTKRILQKINNIEGLTVPFEYGDFQSILEVIQQVYDQVGDTALTELAKILSFPSNVSSNFDDLTVFVENELIPSEPRGVLSPGAMSNAPDRLDGFHTYNLCCRSNQDTGRNPENLRTYNDDRRAFEYWCEGDWAAANYVMNRKVYGKCDRCSWEDNLTADHIGPISLGFQHRPTFLPLCRSCNSAKNNRMSYSDVTLLLADEHRGENVVSWHAKAIWNLYKNRVKTDEEALYLSKLMRVNQHHYMGVLWKLFQRGYVDFLKHLLPLDYADNTYEIDGFISGTDFSFERLVVKSRSSTYSASKKKRFERIAFDALEEYNQKHNRNVQMLHLPQIDQVFSRILSMLEQGSFSQARVACEDYMEAVAHALVSEGVPRAYWRN